MIPEFSFDQTDTHLNKEKRLVLIPDEEINSLAPEVRKAIKKVLFVTNTEKYHIKDIETAIQELLNLQSIHTQSASIGMNFQPMYPSLTLYNYEEAIKFLKNIIEYN